MIFYWYNGLSAVAINRCDHKSFCSMQEYPSLKDLWCLQYWCMLLLQDDVSIVSLTPREQLKARTVRIYSPSKNAMQSGTFGTHKWQIQFDTRERWENPMMGWTATYVSHSLCVDERHFDHNLTSLCSASFLGCQLALPALLSVNISLPTWSSAANPLSLLLLLSIDATDRQMDARLFVLCGWCQ